MIPFLLVPLVACSLWIVGGLVALGWVTRRRPAASATPPPVSVLKPLSGDDPGLSDNLAGFFLQDHPSYEIIFGVDVSDDKPQRVVRELMQRYPAVAARLVVHAGGQASNPKVRNLLEMVRHARHDLWLVSDSNIRVDAHYVREMALTFAARPDIGIVTSVFAGSGESSLGGALESVELNGFCAAGAALPTALNSAAVVGKSMLMSRRVLEQLGGLARAQHVLAEDFVLGKLHQHAGYQVVIAPTVVVNHVGAPGVGTFWRRRLRWSMLRWRLSPLAALLEVLTSPLALAPLAWLVFGVWGLVWAMAMFALRDAGGWLILRGPRGLYWPLLLGPWRDVVHLMVWAIAPLKRHVGWRGHRVRLAMGTLLFEDMPRAR